MKNKRIGSSFEDFLKEEGVYNEVEESAIKKYFAAATKNEMQKQNINKTEMAKKMGTSRAAVNRILDPQNTSLTLQTMEKAASIIGKKIKIKLV